jgi:HK97 family phage prohead protease
MQKIIVKTQEIKSANNAGEFSGFASIFNNVDSYDDIVLPGAFKDSINKKIQLLWQHDPLFPIGKITEIKETVRGLFIKGQLCLETTKGREAYALLKESILDGLSIGFHVEDFFYNDDKRYIKKANLWEISLVTFPANNAARIVEVKSGLECLNTAIDNAVKALKF